MISNTNIEKRFFNIEKENPIWSSYLCFVETIRKQSLNKNKVRRFFLKLVDKNDYEEDEAEEIINYLGDLTKA